MADTDRGEGQAQTSATTGPTVATGEIALEIERENEVVSILDCLRPPASSDLSRKRKLTANTPGNRRSQSVPRKNEPNISAKKRVDEFKGEIFIARQNGSLFCQSYREEISIKKQNISAHVSSTKAQDEQRKTVTNLKEGPKHCRGHGKV